ncbi:MAG TPA: nitrate- and nitrite sensing domain-containing protein, partial [Catenuloplanes sp.]
MSTGPTTLPESGTPTAGARSGWLPRLRDARIRSKLALILVVPVAAVLALATVRLLDVGRNAGDAELVRSLTVLSTDVSGLTQYLHKERMAAATYLADPAAQPDGYAVQVGLTDQRIAAYRAQRRAVTDLPAAVETRLRRIDDHVNALDGTRKEVLDRQQMAVAEAVLRYGVVITDLVAYGDVLGQIAGDSDIADSLRAVAAFARAKAA